MRKNPANLQIVHITKMKEPEMSESLEKVLVSTILAKSWKVSVSINPVSEKSLSHKF